MVQETGKEDSDAAPLVEGADSTRIQSACLQCKKLKRRCDGAKPSCGRCAKLHTDCAYTERRHRGAGKKKDYIEHLEQRLRNLESALQHRSDPLPVNGEGVAGDDGFHQISSPDVQGEHLDKRAMLSLGNRLIGLDHIAVIETHAGSELDPMQYGNVLPAKNVSALDTLPTRLAAFKDGIAATLKGVQSNMDTGPFHRRVFANLLGQQHIRHIIEVTAEDIQLYGTLFTTPSFLRLVDDQYAAGVDNVGANPSRWAVVNAFLASAMLSKVTNDALAAMTPTIWCFFKNAFSTYPELIIGTPDVLACEALLIMAMFMLCSADVQTASQLTAAAARMTHSLGLHRRQFYDSLDPIAAHRHKGVFWIAYILDADLMHKYGLPTSFGDGEVTTAFPGDGPSDMTDLQAPNSTNLLRKRSELAVIQHRIHKLLHGKDTLLQSGVGVVEAVTETKRQLRSWKDTLPERMLRCDSSADGPNMSLILLHHTYYSAMAKIHMVLARLRGPGYSDSKQALTLQGSLMQSSIQMSWTMCAASARGTISVLRNLPPPPFAHVWGTLCYPLSAVLMLLSVILEDPTAAQAELDVAIIGEFVQFLGLLRDDGCDVGRLLDGCTKLQQMAALAVDTRGGEHQSLIQGKSSTGNETLLKLQSIRLKLSRVTDWLHLTQGLLSNIPMLRTEAEGVLVGIFGGETVDGVYGLFVPDIFKSSKYNFSYGS